MLLERMTLELLAQSQYRDVGGPGPPQQEVDVTPLSGPGIRRPWPGSQMVWRVLGFPLSAPSSPGCSLLALKLQLHPQFFKCLGWLLKHFTSNVLCILPHV